MLMNLSSKAIEVGAGNSVMALTFEGSGQTGFADVLCVHILIYLRSICPPGSQKQNLDQHRPSP